MFLTLFIFLSVKQRITRTSLCVWPETWKHPSTAANLFSRSNSSPISLYLWLSFTSGFQPEEQMLYEWVTRASDMLKGEPDATGRCDKRSGVAVRWTSVRRFLLNNQTEGSPTRPAPPGIHLPFSSLGKLHICSVPSHGRRVVTAPLLIQTCAYMVIRLQPWVKSTTAPSDVTATVWLTVWRRSSDEVITGKTGKTGRPETGLSRDR